MTIGKDYIKKELRNFALILLSIALIEFIVLFVFEIDVLLQVFIQVVIFVTMIAAMIRTVSRVWFVWESNKFIDDTNGQMEKQK